MKKIFLIVIALFLFSGNLIAADIPDGITAKIEETYKRFEQWRGTDPVIVFPLMTDIHSFRPNLPSPPDFNDSKCHLLYGKTAAIKFNADFFADLGDIGLDHPTTHNPENAQKRLAANLTIYKNFPLPVLFCMGNHDHNNKSFYISSRDYGEMFNGMTKNKGVPLITGPNSDYGFYDIPGKKCRVFFLNTSDFGYYGFSENQLQFLADNLRLPEGSSAVVLEHYCVPAIGHWNSFLDTKAQNEKIFIKILEARAANTKGSEKSVHWDFTQSRQVSLVGVICGDSHFDHQTKINGVHYIITQGYGGINPKEASQGSVHLRFDRSKDLLIDVAAIKPDKKIMKIFRIGAGGAERDREFKF